MCYQYQLSVSCPRVEFHKIPFSVLYVQKWTKIELSKSKKQEATLLFCQSMASSLSSLMMPWIGKSSNRVKKYFKYFELLYMYFLKTCYPRTTLNIYIISTDNQYLKYINRLHSYCNVPVLLAEN